jgi:hypothetical protein
MGINARSRMANLQTLFPNAKFTDSKPAWLKPYQRLIEVSGPGIEGSLALKIEHEVEGSRVLAKELAVRQANKTLEPWQGSLMPYLSNKLAEWENNPPADPWEVKDIRWAPPTPITIRAASSKYGQPESDGLDEQFHRILSWPKRGITAYVDVNDKITLFVFSFTTREYICADQDAPKACNSPDSEAKPERSSKRAAKR